jgi:hypothetical protein
MGDRGPKPVEVVVLKKYARVWANLFHLLRDGQPGQLVRLKPGESLPTVVADVLPADREKTLKGLPQLEKLRGKQGIIWLLRPVFPEPHLWEQLKSNHSVKEIQRTIASIEKYIRKRWPYPYSYSTDRDGFLIQRRAVWSKTLWARLLRAARDSADEVLKARDLPHFPRSERPSSDDKRVEFFAKVFAGLAVGLSPLTATKRLSGWSPFKAEIPKSPIPAQGPNCPHCGIDEVKGFPPRTIVLCPGCDERYYIAANRHTESRR